MTAHADHRLHASGSHLRHVMLVGNTALTAAIEQVLDEIDFAGEVLAVDGYLVALADAPTFEPDLVIGNVDGLQGDADEVARAFRELLPDVHLVLLAWPEEMEAARRTVDGGFDSVLVKPIDARHISRLLTESLRRPPGETASRVEAELRADEAQRTPMDEAQAADRDDAQRSDAAPPAADRPERPPGFDLQHAARPATPDSAREDLPADRAADVADPMTLPVDATLGDVDLLETMLSSRESISDRALRLVRGQSGVRDIQWAAPDERVPDGRHAAAVRFEQTVYGQLHADPSMDAATLGAWGAWLARWMAVQAELRELRRLAYTDELTGVWNRRYFNRALERLVQRAREERFRVTLMVYDIDNFKSYNDNYGHAAGDEILRETARLMKTTVREHDIVARIGGDEFAVIYWDAEEPRRPNSRHPETVKAAAKRFQQAVVEQQFPKLLETDETITISGGLAGYPWDAQDPESLLALADKMAMQSKENGKNALTFGPGALRVSNGDFNEPY